jgi:hypothetical protein
VADPLSNLAPFELTAGIGLHFPAYLSMGQDCIWVLRGSGWELPDRSRPWDQHMGAIGILRIKFVPEPSGWVVLVAGLGFLMVFYRVRTRRHRSSSAVRQVN